MTNVQPLSETLDAAEDIQIALRNITRDFEYAIERQRIAKQNAQTAANDYADGEAEAVFDIKFGDDEDYKKAKNEGDRKAVIDVRLIKARQAGGPLFVLWGLKTKTEQEVFDADLAFLQAEARFKAVRTAAYLKANTLHALAIA